MTTRQESRFLILTGDGINRANETACTGLAGGQARSYTSTICWKRQNACSILTGWLFPVDSHLEMTWDRVR